MTPMSISVFSETGPVALWQNPTPNSFFLTRPIHLFKAKESRGFTGSIFPELQASLDGLSYPRNISGFLKQVEIDTKITIISSKGTLVRFVTIVASREQMQTISS